MNKLQVKIIGLSNQGIMDIPNNIHRHNYWLTPDVCLNVGTLSPVKLLAHGFVLVAESEYFNDLLKNYEYKSELKIYLSLSEFEPESFYHVLSYLYNGNVQLSINNVFSVIMIANILKIQNLLNICHNYLKTNNEIKSTNIVKPIPSRPNVAVKEHASVINYTLSCFQPSVNTSFSQYQKANSNFSTDADLINLKLLNNNKKNRNVTILDIACCDGPVKFEKVLNSKHTYHSKITIGDFVNKDKLKNVSSERTKYIFPNITDHKEASKFKKKIKESFNFQSFPCKLCGSKFPSYYFMNKHKRHCSF